MFPDVLLVRIVIPGICPRSARLYPDADGARLDGVMTTLG
jgi:hypothetical protein